MKKKVVIIGGGFGGLEAAKVLAGKGVEVLLFDKTNHHLFQPLLYQVATGLLSPDDVSVPIRYLFRGNKNIEVLMDEIKSVDLESKVINLTHGATPVLFDYVIIATGARHSYFKNPEWEHFAPGIKTLTDALKVRQKFLSAFEEAEQKAALNGMNEEVKELLTVVIIGGGPTGCELAGVIPETIRYALLPDYKHISASDCIVLLVEAGDKVLSTFPAPLSKRAWRDLQKLGVTIKTNTRVTEITERSVTLSTGEIVPTRTVLWAAGNVAKPLPLQKIETDTVGRIVVQPDLSIPHYPWAYAIGDCAHAKSGDGTLVPGVAQGAIQGGKTAASNILRQINGQPTQTFRYRDKGNLAILGRRKAIADFGWITFTGVLAFLIWVFVHLLFLVGFRNKISVLLQWGYSYLTYQRGVRIIYSRKGI